MNNEVNFRSKVEVIFREVLQNEQLKFSDNLQARDVAGWNSLNHMRIIVEIEKKLAIQFKPREVVALNNYGDLLKMIEQKLQATMKAKP